MLACFWIYPIRGRTPCTWIDGRIPKGLVMRVPMWTSEKGIIITTTTMVTVMTTTRGKDIGPLLAALAWRPVDRRSVVHEVLWRCRELLISLDLQTERNGVRCE